MIIHLAVVLGVWESIRSSADHRRVMYYRRRFSDGTWLAVSRNNKIWHWAHYGPVPGCRHAGGEGARTSRLAKTQADEYIADLAAKGKG
jgi:hypothetical protein